jgi:hypothetical protein
MDTEQKITLVKKPLAGKERERELVTGLMRLAVTWPAPAALAA